MLNKNQVVKLLSFISTSRIDILKWERVRTHWEENFHPAYRRIEQRTYGKSEARDFRLFMQGLVIIKFKLTHVGAL